MVFVRDVLRRFKRLVLVVIGLLCLGLGIIGYVLPGLPGTIWLIIAATLFLRSSDKLYKFVVGNRMFGKGVAGFLETGAMPLRAKILALTFMWTFSVISVLLAPYGWLFKVPILILAVMGTVFIISRPTSKM